MAKKQKPKSNKARVIIIIVLVIIVLGLIAGGLYYLYKRMTEPYTSFDVTYTEEITTGEGVQYLSYLNGYLRLTHDGAEAVDSTGARLWNVSFSMNNPMASISGNYAAVGDVNGRVLYMMDGTGTVYKTEMPYDICEVESSSIGVAAVRMYSDGDDYIRMVNLAGETLVDIKTVETKDGFPIDMALSSDGKKLVTSYLVIDGDEAGGWINFYNFGSVGKNYSNNVTGVFKYDKIAARLEFMDESNLCAFTDDSFKLFSVPETPSLTAEITFDDRILTADVSEDYVAVMLDGTSKGAVSHTLAYDTKGKNVYDSVSSSELTGLMVFGDTIMFTGDYACQILRLDNSIVYNGNFDGRRIEKIMSVNDKDKLLLFESGQVSTIQLTKGGATE